MKFQDSIGNLKDFFFQAENEYCLLLALPCGLDQEDVHNQTHALKTGFITYLQAKQAAGIINVPNPGSNQVSPLKNENYSASYNHVQYRVSWKQIAWQDADV